MAEQFSAEWAKGIIDENVQKAQAFIDDPEQINGLLGQLQEKLQGLPETVGTAFGNVPAMAQMVKCYVTREYTNVSPKVVASLVAAFIYLVKKEDIISDSIPILGYVDDLAVATVAMAINEREINDFLVWRDQQDGYLVPADEAAAEAEVVAVEENVADAGTAEATNSEAVAEAAAANAVEEPDAGAAEAADAAVATEIVAANDVEKPAAEPVEATADVAIDDEQSSADF